MPTSAGQGMTPESVPFGKYTLVRKIATGGMAEIFLAKQPGPEGVERYIVIKRILPHLSENPDFVRMFLDEMRIAVLLSHPNVVQIHDVGAIDGQYFIAMEYLEGRDVRRMMRKASARTGGVPLPVSLRIVAGACAGLDYAHNRRDAEGRPLNIVHRDVSPQNVIVTVQGAVKILDFGVAKAESQFYETRSGVLKGKYAYMSPEQAAGMRVDARSDIFPLGTILYELTTGRRLFKHDNEVVVLKMVSEAAVVPPTTIFPSYPRELEQIVMRALAQNPDHRYQSCRELQDDIEQLADRRHLGLAINQLGDYVTGLLEDEPSVTTPGIASRPTVQGYVSFMHPEESDSVVRTPSVQSRPSPSRADESGLSKSLSVLLQGVRRRPGLTIGIGTACALLVAGAIVLAVLVGGRADGAATGGPAGGGEGGATGFPTDAQGAGDLVAFGTIQVESTPTGARVFVDGEEQESPTPVTVPMVVVGEQHFVVVELQGHTAQARRVQLGYDGDFQTLSFSFGSTASPGRVAFEGLSDDASVLIDGQTRSPGNYAVEPGVPHTVVVVVSGDELLREEVVAAAGGEVTLRVPDTVASTGGDAQAGSPPTGILVLSSDPPTTVYVGKRALGTTPVRAEVKAGSHVVRFVNRNLLVDYSQRVRVDPGGRAERSIAIPSGKLRVSARPYAEVSVNGREQGRTPLLKTLYAGTYTVVLSNGELGKRERFVVKIRGGSDERVRVDWR